MAQETLPRELVAHVPGAFLGLGEKKDVDEALDDARELAREEYGHAGTVPSVADVDVDDVVVVSERPTSRAQALRRAQAELAGGDLEPGRIHALALAPDSAFKRRKPTLRTVDTELELGTEARVLPHVPSDLETRLLALLIEAGTPVEEGEVLEEVDLKRVTARYKPVATPHRGSSENTFAVRLAGTHELVSEGHASAGEARRAATDAVKAGAVLGREQVTLEVVKVVGRAGGLPLLSVERSRVAQRGTLKLTLASEKDPTKTKHVGWLFYGLAAPDTQAVEETEG